MKYCWKSHFRCFMLSPSQSFPRSGLLLEASCPWQGSSDTRHTARPSSVLAVIVAASHECGVCGDSCARLGKACSSHPSGHVAEWLPDYQDPLLLRTYWLARAQLGVALRGSSAVGAAAMATPHREGCPGHALSGAHWRRGKWRLSRMRLPLR